MVLGEFDVSVMTFRECFVEACVRLGMSREEAERRTDRAIKQSSLSVPEALQHASQEAPLPGLAVDLISEGIKSAKAEPEKTIAWLAAKESKRASLN